jgi:hypothetical protein
MSIKTILFCFGWYLAFDLGGGIVTILVPIIYEYEQADVLIMGNPWGIPYMTHDHDQGAVHHMFRSQHVISHD